MAVSLCLLFFSIIFCDAAIVEIVSVLPGLIPPYDPSSYLNGYARITWKYLAAVGGATTFPAPFAVQCGIWINSTDSGALSTDGFQELFLTTTGGGGDFPENFYNTHVSGSQSAFSVAKPGSNVVLVLQCRYNNKSPGPEAATCVSNSPAYPLNGVNQALCPSSPGFPFLWAPTPNVPPLTVTKINSSFINVSYVHDSVVEGYANVYYELQQSNYSNFTTVLQTLPYTADRYDVSTNQTRIQAVDPGFVYYLRMRAWNGYKYSNYSNIVQVIAEDTPPTPTAVSADIFNKTAIFLDWNETTLPWHFATRQIQCSTVQLGGSVRYSAAKPYIYVGAVNELVLGQTYFCSVRLENDNGTGIWNTSAGFLFAVKPEPPTGLTATVDTAFSVNLSWTPGSDNGAAITDSIVEYHDVGVSGPWIPLAVGNPVPFYTLKNLLSNHYYLIRVSSKNTKGTGDPSDLGYPYFVVGAPNITGIAVVTGNDTDSGPNIRVSNTLGNQGINISGGGFNAFGAPTVTYGNGKFACNVTYFNAGLISCTLEAGVGTNLAFVVTSGASSSQPSDNITNPVTLSYPPPTIDPASLHRQFDTYPYKDPLPAETSISELLIFTGTNFGPNNNKNPLNVTYGPPGNPTKYNCTVFDFTPTQISCFTQTAPVPTGDPNFAQSVRNLTFRVIAGGQTSNVGVDRYNYPIAPVITNITGCPRVCNDTDPWKGTCDCSTHGNINLTIFGTDLTEPLSFTIRGVPCLNVTYSNLTTQVQCTLQEGTGGLLLPVVGTQVTYPSIPYDLVSYKTPTVATATGCSLADNYCDRNGGDVIDITGLNFGSHGANAFVGGVICTKTQHVVGEEHEHLRCQVPAGAGLKRVISVLQFEGDLSVGIPPITIDYQPCPAGTKPTDPNLCDSCAPGFYTDSAGSPACKQCPAGKFNTTIGATACAECPTGKFNLPDGPTPTECQNCSAGFYTASPNQAACIKCPFGTNKSVGGDQACSGCPTGQFQDQDGQLQCKNCTAGYFAGSSGTIRCDKCAPGTASAQSGASSCGACQAGEYQSLPGQTECLKCPAGLFSPVNSSVCLNCSAGFYSPQNGSSGCMACPDGFYQSNPGQDQCLPCRVGEYKTYDFYRGSVSCLVCPAGSYSNQTNSSSCDLCTPGTYQDSSNKTNCSLCDYGQYQPLDGKIDCLECDSGYYGNTQGRSQCLSPPGGFFAVKRFNGTRGAVNYSACLPGFTSSSDHTGCTLCPGGRFNPYYGDICALCIPGRFTIDTTDIENPNINCTVCGAGKYAPVNGSTRCYDCAKGLFSQAESQQCDQCPGGSIVDDTQAKCTNCSIGQYAPEGALNCSDCPIGKFSSHNGTAVCTDCTSGSASDLIGAHKCDVCGQGSSSRPGASECVKCDLGTYAPENGTTTCFQCGPGTFVNNTGQTGCIDCDPGSYSAANSSKVCTLCTSGYYTGVKRSTYCIKCPARTFSGGSGNTICATCGKGYVVNRDATGCLDDYWQEPEVVGFYSFLGAAGLGTIVLTVLSLIYLRENRLIYYSSPPFMYTILAGMSLVWASVILIIVNQQPWICHLKYVFLNIGVAIVLMCVTTKTWRLHRIFNRNKQDALKTVVIKDSTLFVWVFAFVGWDILVLAVWWGVAMFSVDDLVHKCITLWEPWVHIALWFWKPLVILYLIYLCIKVRSIDERFNESWWIGIGIYNVVVVLILFLILTLTLPLRPREWFIMFDTVIAYLIGTSWALIFLPKYYQIYKKKHENEELFGAEIASDITEAEEVAEEEKHDEATDEAEKKKGISVDKGDDALTKLHIKREKKAKELNKLLKIVDRTKQRMKTDITNLNHLSSDVLALHQEIEYRKKLLNKKGVVVSNKPKDKQDLEMTQQQQSTVNLHADAGSSDAYASPTPSKPGTELEPADEQPHLEPSSYNNYEA